ncbi:MAG: response regulator [Methanosarcinaceae archaeon]|jgi:two-component system response regulator|nr:response regulator [Methanosarcinaceae archaeon]NKQ38504.1 response regulator [Methanosarcinales archaeon]
MNILIVEDLYEHVLIIKNALKRLNTKNQVFVVMDGEEAIDFLFNQGKYESIEKAPKPDIILLDLNLPKFNGLEVLEKIKNDIGLKDIPVVILTSSKKDDDILEAYELGAKSYIQKSLFIESDTNKIEKLFDTIFYDGIAQ